jgi:hypothetical protein
VWEREYRGIEEYEKNGALARAEEKGGINGAAAENHDSNVGPTVRPRSQISDNHRIVTADIFALL